MKFVLPLKPRGAARPRKSKAGHIYEVPEDKAYKQFIRDFIQVTLPGSYRVSTDPMYVHINMYIKLPKSSQTIANKVKVTEGILHPVVKPDVDNLAKLILDAMNGIIYEDDKQVIELSIKKHYTLHEDEVHIEVGQLC